MTTLAMATKSAALETNDVEIANVEDEVSSSDVEMVSEDDDPSEDEKSDAELELERAVFGDSSGFRSELASFGPQGRLSQATAATQDTVQELADITDADLFFLDAGPDDGHQVAPLPSKDKKALTTHDAIYATAVWHDPADAQFNVSLMSHPRLRKLRTFEGEDVVSGIEYQQRLRQQYEALHPRPKWAEWTPPENQPRKRRRVDSNEDSSSVSDSELEADDDDSDVNEVDLKPLDTLMRSSASLLTTAPPSKNGIPKLRRDAISISRMKEFSPAQPHAITSLSLHPRMPVIMSSGLTGNAYIHRLRNRPIPPEPANPLLTTMHFKNIPLSTCVFARAPSPSTPSSAPPTAISRPRNDLGLIHLSSRRRFMHTLDMSTGHLTKINRLAGHEHTQRSFEYLKVSPCGAYIALRGSTRKHRAGIVNVLSALTSQLLCAIHIEAPAGTGVADLAWWSDSAGLSIVDGSGEVSEYSLARRRIIARWRDEGRGITTIALANARHLATTKRRAAELGVDTLVVLGSTLGLVTVYARADIPLPESTPASEDNPIAPTLTPLRTLKNLTTAISHLSVSPDAQLLAIASRHKRSALRLVHLPTLGVYKNWPTAQTPLGRVSALLLGEMQGEEGEERRLCLWVGNERGVLMGFVVNG